MTLVATDDNKNSCKMCAFCVKLAKHYINLLSFKDIINEKLPLVRTYSFVTYFTINDFLYSSLFSYKSIAICLIHKTIKEQSNTFLMTSFSFRKSRNRAHCCKVVPYSRNLKRNIGKILINLFVAKHYTYVCM